MEELQKEKPLLQQKEEAIALHRQQLQQVRQRPPAHLQTAALQADMPPPAFSTLSGSRRNGETQSPKLESSSPQ